MTELIKASPAGLSGLQRRMRNIVQAIPLPHPGIHWEINVHSNEYFPFRSYASAVEGSGPQANERIVMSIQCHRPGGQNGDRVQLYADVAREDGAVLAESPHQELALGEHTFPDGALSRELTSGVDSLECWLKSQIPLVQRELASGSDAN